MAEPHLSFSVKASFDQRLSLVVFVCICASSLLFWPRMDNPLYFALKCVLALSTLVFLVWQLWQLRHWQRQFVLNGNGEGRFSNGEDFRLLRRTWVTPFVCLIYYESQGKAHLLPLWADMLSDTDYRHLCRLLLKAKSGEPT